jgi:hypothetical protein
MTCSQMTRSKSQLCSRIGGCCSPPLSGMVWVLVARCRVVAVGLVAVWWVDLCFFLASCRRCGQVHSERSTGCVPGRCFSFVCSFCGSIQSLCAMVLLLALAFLPSSSYSDVGLGDDGDERWAMAAASTKDSKDLFVFSLFSGVYCVRWFAQLSSL